VPLDVSPDWSPVMAFRLERNGFVIHVDTVEEVRALLSSLEDAPPAPTRRVKPTRDGSSRLKPTRGRSNGALDGRILDILNEQGPMKPGALAEACKAERAHVRAAVNELEAAGKVSIEGVTASRTISLAQANGRPKEAVR